MIEFLKAVFTGAYDFWGFIKILGDFFNGIGETRITGELTLSAIFTSPGLYSYILAAVGLIFLLYGRKFMTLILYIAFGVAGYVVGGVFVYPLLLPTMSGSILCTPLICSIAMAIVGVVFSKLLYGVLYIAAGAAFTYVICCGGGLIPGLPTVGNPTLSYIAVAIVVLALLIMRKNVTRLGLSMAGAYFIVEAGSKNFFLLANPTNFIVMGAVALLGFAFQYKRRKRYM